MVRAGIPTHNHSGHSFCIGAAMVAAQADSKTPQFQALGRWSSNAFLRYIRRPQDTLAHWYSCTLSGGQC